MKRGKVMRTKRLTKSNNKMVCGVCAGIAEYFGSDLRGVTDEQ